MPLRLGLLVAFVATLLVAPAARAEEDEPEGTQQERFEWFYGMRGLLRPGADVEGARRARLRATEELLATPRWSAGARWTSIGPSPIDLPLLFGPQAGRTTDLTFGPYGGLPALYLSTSTGGVWATTDLGTTWSCITTRLPSQSIGTTAISAAGSEIWIGTGDYNSQWNLATYVPYFGAGIYRSIDGGGTWQSRTGSGAAALPLGAIGAISLDPRDAGTLLAGGNGIPSGNQMTEGGIWRTTDAGDSWSQVYGRNTFDILRHPGDPDLLYAGTRGSTTPGYGVARSTDGGASWAEIGAGITARGGRARLAMAPSNPGVLYYLNSDGTLHRSPDGGATWVLRSSNACQSQCTYNLALAVDPSDPLRVYRGDTVPYLSTNGGVNWSALSGYGIKLHPDVQHIEFDPSDPGTAYFGTDGGLFRTRDGGQTFTNVNGNLNITQFYDIATHPTLDSVVMGGSQDTGSAHYSGLVVWSPVPVLGDGMVQAIDPVNPDICYSAMQPQNGPSILRSTTGPGGPFTEVSGGITDTNMAWVTPYALDPAAPTTIYVATHRVWRSTDSGGSWNALGADLSTSDLQSLAIAPSDPATIYAGGEQSIWGTTDSGASWRALTTFSAPGTVADIAVDPADARHVLATHATFLGPTLHASTDGGQSWSAVTGGLPPVPAISVLVVPGPYRVFVGTDVGVYVSGADAGPYRPDVRGLPPGIPVTELELNPVTGTITAGTYGRGAWQRTDIANRADVTVGKGAAGASGHDSRVKAYRVDGSAVASLDVTPFAGSGFGANSAGGDLDFDQIDELLVGQGPGSLHPPVGRGFTRAGQPLPSGTWTAYGGSGFGLNVATADVDGDGAAEVLTGPGEGPVYAPQVRAWRFAGGPFVPMAKINFYAYGTLKYGVNPAGGNGDLEVVFDEILTGAGPGDVFGPHVREWSYDGTSITPLSKISFFAYSTLKYGVNAALGDVDGEGIGEIVTGPGPGAVFGPQVRGFDVDTGSVATIARINFLPYASFRRGANVATGDLDDDGFAEIATGPGPDPVATSSLKGFDDDGTGISQIATLDLEAWPGLSYGVTVGTGAYGY